MIVAVGQVEERGRGIGVPSLDDREDARGVGELQSSQVGIEGT